MRYPVRWVKNPSLSNREDYIMSGKIYGYVRVSTRYQHEDRQLAAMREYGVARSRIVV